MDNLLEILIPLIFAAIYFFGNMFSGKSGDEDGSPDSPQRRERSNEEVEAAERQRRIQEEIRRKIMDRRQASGGERPSQPVSPAQKLPERREAHAQAREMEPRRSEAQPPPLVRTNDQSAERPNAPTFSWDESDNVYENSMQERLEQIEATKRRAEKLKREADAARKQTKDTRSKTDSRKGRRYLGGPIRESLQDPAAARVAFIYGEVLGRPVSQRKEASSVPGLN